ncbi:MAG: DNA/RNA non-specific endonuclease [Phycisphaerae bacterium]|nr:DNA/RNA non-specific endonuclease [Phycisphaerae bacterium]
MNAHRNRRTRACLSSLVLLVLCGACAQLQTRTILVKYAKHAATLTPQQMADFERHCGVEWGMPEKTEDLGQTFYISHDGYVMEYGAWSKTALWVCHHVTKEQLVKTFEGKYERPSWKEEKELPARFQARDTDYPPWGRPYNRGHMAPNADFGSREGRHGTFILSNAVPQQWENNRDIWADLEAMVRQWIQDRGEAYIITGPLLYDPTDDPLWDRFDPDKSDGLIYYEVMGDSEVAVPTHLFKIVVAPEAEGSQAWESLAIVLENRNYSEGSDETFDDDLELALRSIDWIEARAGLNFLPSLPDGSPEEIALESAAPAQLWPH